MHPVMWDLHYLKEIQGNIDEVKLNYDSFCEYYNLNLFNLNFYILYKYKK